MDRNKRLFSCVQPGSIEYTYMAKAHALTTYAQTWLAELLADCKGKLQGPIDRSNAGRVAVNRYFRRRRRNRPA